MDIVSCYVIGCKSLYIFIRKKLRGCALEHGLTAAELEPAWQADLARFMEVRQEFLLYPE